MHKERVLSVHVCVYMHMFICGLASALEYMINAYVCMFVYFQPNAQGTLCIYA